MGSHLFQSVEISIKLFNLPIEDHQRDSRYRLRQWSLLEHSFRVSERDSRPVLILVC
jgi:hypothetical protein